MQGSPDKYWVEAVNAAAYTRITLAPHLSRDIRLLIKSGVGRNQILDKEQSEVEIESLTE